MKKDDVVEMITADVYSRVAGRLINPGTRGKVLAAKDEEVLVKFQGFSWPKVVDVTDVRCL